MCSIDWPIVFSGLKTLLDPLAIAAWPLMLAWAFHVFKRPISGLIDRVKTVRGPGLEAEIRAIEDQTVLTAPDFNIDITAAPLSSSQAEQDPALPSNLPPGDSLFDKHDDALLRELNDFLGDDCEAKLRWAVRTRTVSEIERFHESTYRVIFGSQLAALKAINNTSPCNTNFIRPFYETFSNSPDHLHFAKEFDFERWLSFLTKIEYVNRNLNPIEDRLTIAPMGRHFCMWLSARGIPDFKPG